MAEEDPDLEKELLGDEGALQGDDGEDVVMDEAEFLENADELDLPEDEDLGDEDEDDLKGEDTDSELEDYYRELGIETEEKGDEYKKKKSKKAATKERHQPSEQAISREEARKKVLNDLIEKTRAQPTYTSLTRVIKIVK
jgi:hypothetical protein